MFSDKNNKSAKLRDFLRIKKLERTCQFAREIKADELEKQLKNTKNKEEKSKLKKELKILDSIFEKEANYNTDQASYS